MAEKSASQPDVTTPRDRVAMGLLVLWAATLLAIRMWPDQVGAPFNLFEAYAAYAMAPIWPALVYARHRRARTLTAVCLFLALAHLGWTFDWVPRWLSAPVVNAASGPHLRLVTANLLAPRPSPELAREILAMDGDVIVASELSSGWSEVLRAEGVYRAYPEVREEVIPAPTSYFGIGVLSRAPITDHAIERVFEIPLIRVDLEVEGEAARLYAFHAHPPTGSGALALWSEQMAVLERHVTDDVRAGRRLVVTGDFNATTMTRAYRRLCALGLTPAHDAAFRPFATTWPNGVFLFPPIRIDHVLLSGFAVRSIAEGVGAGSDHQPIVTDLVLE